MPASESADAKSSSSKLDQAVFESSIVLYNGLVGRFSTSRLRLRGQCADDVETHVGEAVRRVIV